MNFSSQAVVNFSSQAIVIDTHENIYLERNKKIGALSLIGGKVEGNESFEEALLREFGEELGINIQVDRLLHGEKQPQRSFPTGEWVSKYFVIILSEEEALRAENSENIEKYNFQEIENLNSREYPIERQVFLRHIQRALESL